ncbi:MAG TPA: methyltransferase [Gammaproteobacteria bacterium]|nr:methyltransferase [Gammaproteobacteria bacterium]
METHAKNLLVQLALAGVVSHAISCAAELELADLLGDGPLDLEELAVLASCSPSHLHRLLRALSTVGVFALVDGKVALTPAAQWLRRKNADSLWPLVSFFGKEMNSALATLPVTVRTGQAGWNSVFSSPFWQYLDEHPERGQAFDAMMSGLCEQEVDAIVTAYDFSRAETVVDLGGGNGSVLHAVLRRNPDVVGVLFDSPKVVERLRENAAVRAWNGRWRCIAGSFFDSAPTADLYVLRHVLHDWPDTSARRILETCRAHCAPAAHILVIEHLVENDNAPSRAKWMDLGMMVNFGGQERTFAEYSALCAAAGLQVSRVIKTKDAISIIEAEPS